MILSTASLMVFTGDLRNRSSIRVAGRTIDEDLFQYQSMSCPSLSKLFIGQGNSLIPHLYFCPKIPGLPNSTYMSTLVFISYLIDPSILQLGADLDYRI
jgi:hypothetical protein